MSGVEIGTAAGQWGRRREFAARQDNGNVDYGPIQLRFVHVSNGRLGVGLVSIEDICCAPIRPNYAQVYQ